MEIDPLSFPQYNWQIAYRDALLETNRVRITAKIRVAEEIVEARLNELMYSADGSVERQALEDALRALQFLEHHS